MLRLLFAFNPVNKFGGPLRKPSRRLGQSNWIAVFNYEFVLQVDILFIEGYNILFVDAFSFQVELASLRFLK
jgi:hypothetical protein